MKISYDEATDTLYLFMSDQQNTVARDIGNGMLLKIDRKTNKPVGVVIHDFEKRFRIQHQPIEIPVSV